MDGIPHGVAARLAEAKFEQSGDASGHLDRPEDGLNLAEEAAGGRVRGRAQRAGVRDGHGYAVHAHRQLDAEGCNQLQDRGRDPLPLVVGLGTGEQEERRSGPIDHAVQNQRRVVIGGPAILVEGHRRTPPAVVEQLVDVETRDNLGRVVLQEVGGEQPLGAPGIDETAEGGDEHTSPYLGGVGVVLESVERCRVLHVLILPSADVASTRRAPEPFRAGRREAREGQL